MPHAHRRRFASVASAALGCLFLIPLATSALAQPATTSWLDQPTLAGWNQAGATIPAPPTDTLNNDPTCRAIERQPTNAQEQQVAKAGWKLFHDPAATGSVDVVWALGTYDGMCRPWNYQAFVFDNGKFAGTLSPQPMADRNDGALESVTLDSAGAPSATFARYGADDPACCPSQTATVQYQLQTGSQGPVVVPVFASQSPNQAEVAGTSPGAAGSAAVVNTPSVDYDGVHVVIPPAVAQYDPGIAQTVSWMTAPASTSEDPADTTGTAPQHTLIAFLDQSGSDLPDLLNPRAPQLRVFPVDGLRAISPDTSQKVDALAAMLKARPTSTTGEIGIVPTIPQAQIVHAHIHYLDFKGGSGVAFVTGFANEASPITNTNASYVFQGLTQDGGSYVSLFWPISNGVLPPDVSADMGNNDVYDAFVKNFPSYASKTVADLNAQSADSFTPSLSLLDSMLSSIQVSR